MIIPAFVITIVNTLRGRWPEFWAAVIWCWKSWIRPAGADSTWEQGLDGDGR